MCRTRSCEDREAGYTLAALLVILTIISLVIAYTVPEQWSMIMKRERERHTIFLMKQYARAIYNWERKHQALPVSLEQLQKARDPRMLRGSEKLICPLTGREDDWIMVPITAIEAQPGGAAVNPGGQAGVGVGRPQQQQGQQPQAGAMPPSKLNSQASPKDYVGPFVAVRPNATGASMIALKGAEDYSQWVYTLQDLKNEIQMQQLALSLPK
ncbi:MAG TPA: type II secretion system protein [Thermoanaerobaculia bacterium]|nr:type II secretion system protein [Thermoanaerobaculia bacterium]